MAKLVVICPQCFMAEKKIELIREDIRHRKRELPYRFPNNVFPPQIPAMFFYDTRYWCKECGGEWFE